jgi:Putative adhesin
MVAIGPVAALAQDDKAPKAPAIVQTPKPTPRVSPTPQTPNVPKVQPAPRPSPAPKAYDPYIQTPHPQAPNVQVGPVTMKVARGSKVGITSRSTRVTVIGVDGENLEATATSEAGQEPVQTQVTGDPAHPDILIFVPANHPRRAGKEVRLSVKVPRYVEIETVESRSGDIEVRDIDAGVVINSGTGQVTVSRVAALKVGSRSGNLNIRDVKGDLLVRSTNGDALVDSVGGSADVAATNGSLQVRNVAGDVRANSATGDVDIHCAKGRAEISSASGSITLVGVAGDAEATTVSGEVIFKGNIRSNGRYNFKSVSGEVEMLVQPDPPGFTATLVTYSGEVETEFRLKVDTPLQRGPINRRIVGRYGEGQAQIKLDSFSGGVRLAKGNGAQWKECK